MVREKKQGGQDRRYLFRLGIDTVVLQSPPSSWATANTSVVKISVMTGIPSKKGHGLRFRAMRLSNTESEDVSESPGCRKNAKRPSLDECRPRYFGGQGVHTACIVWDHLRSPALSSAPPAPAFATHRPLYSACHTRTSDGPQTVLAIESKRSPGTGRQTLKTQPSILLNLRRAPRRMTGSR